MLTKGIIINKIGNDNHYLVRIPILENAGDTTQSIVEATLAYTAGIVESLNVDDVVIVGFENHNATKPIIIGKLWLQDDLSSSRGFANLESLSVKSSASLPNDITFGGKEFNNISGMLEHIEDIDAGSVTSVNGQVGDVVLDIPSGQVYWHTITLGELTTGGGSGCRFSFTHHKSTGLTNAEVQSMLTNEKCLGGYAQDGFKSNFDVGALMKVGYSHSSYTFTFLTSSGTIRDVVLDASVEASDLVG